MMKKIALIVFIMTMSVSILYSQDIYKIREAWFFFKSNELQTGGWRTVLSRDNVQGSPYLNEEFKNGIIFTKSKYQFNNIPVRYNIYNNELEFKTTENRILAVANPEILERVKFNDVILEYTDYLELDKKNKGFLRLLVEGDASLYSKSEIIFREPAEAAAFKDPKPAKYLQKPDTYYIRFGDDVAKKIRSKKEIIELFPTHRNEISSYIKNNKIKPRNSDKLQELVCYYNSL